MAASSSPFLLENEAAYKVWREAKLASHPRSLSDLVVEIGDPRRLTAAEHEALLDRCRRANMVIYAGRTGSDPDKAIPRELGRRFGLESLDANFKADEDGITPLAVSSEKGRGDFIPYTDRPIKWHTDGYYNPPGRQIRGMVLHCVSLAAEGGDNALMDQEMAYLLLRDQNPAHIRALMLPDAMTIPAREDASEDGNSCVARPAETGPVFVVMPDGSLHMRYTARTRSIEWKDAPEVKAAVQALETLLASDSPHIFRGRLAPGMGLLCNNVLHDRTGFKDSPDQKRLIYRLRFYDRIAGT